jgi:hypothetical protein
MGVDGLYWWSRDGKGAKIVVETEDVIDGLNLGGLGVVMVVLK